jgi:hypothetical protein
VLNFPSVQCGEPDAEHIGNFNVGHAAFTALAGDYNHSWAVNRFATSGVAEGAPVAERRASLSAFRQWVTRVVHERTLSWDLTVCRQRNYKHGGNGNPR